VIENRKIDDVDVWTPEGRLDASSAPQLEESMLAAIEAGADAVVLDLARVRYMSSAGLRVVLVVARALQQGQGRFIVCGLNEEVAELFAVSGFGQIVRIESDLDRSLVLLQ